MAEFVDIAALLGVVCEAVLYGVSIANTLQLRHSGLTVDRDQCHTGLPCSDHTHPAIPPGWIQPSYPNRELHTLRELHCALRARVRSLLPRSSAFLLNRHFPWR